MSPPHASPAPLRLGLTWRVILLSSLLLLALAGLFSWLGHEHLTRQFQDSRNAHRMQQANAIQQALVRSEETLQQLATLAASAQRLGPALQQGRDQELVETLDSQWPTLLLDAGVDEMQVFDARGNPRATEGESEIENRRLVQLWAQQVMDAETPLTTLHCHAKCRQYTVVPVLVDGSSIGTVVLSRPLAGTTLQVQQVSGDDVGLLVVTPSPPDDLPVGRYLTPWNGHLQALTRQEERLSLFQSAARRFTLADLTNAAQRLEHGDREFELHAVRLPGNNATGTRGYFLMAADITAQVQAIQANTHTLLLAGLGGWLAAELLLLVILLSPMARLRRIAEVLPQLARGGFAEARTAIPEPRRRLPDEIDVLEGTTLELAHQLETLQGEVTARGEQLAERVKELARERDFVGSLLNTAQVFIVTQDAEGRITLVNDHALSIMATREERLLGRLFEDAFAAGDSTSLDSRSRQEERPLTTPDGQRLTIAWYHAPLPMGNGVTGRISVGLDITERKVAEARLTWLAERDPLTGLYNRRFFQEAVSRGLSHARHGAVLLMDLDQFKDINELSGHQAGDQLLREVATRLYEAFGHRATLARLGGDEFALLLEGADGEQAVSIAQQAGHLLESRVFDVGGQRHRVISSTGIVLFPLHGDNAADLLANADMAMYEAKTAGGQGWHLLSTETGTKDELQNRVYWIERLQQALEEDDFTLMVQPIMHLESREIRHYEVLLRMHDDDRRLISPGHFIPVAEHSGQIVPLDRWVLRHTLRALACLRQQGISLAVNLSGRSLHDAGLERYLADELAASGADPSDLILEITETAAVTDFATARGVLQAIRDLGCQTALDDFGVGFSSFHYLGQLPVDYIKIDGSFIRTLTTNAESRVIVRAIADIATGFGKKAIAEFVDKESSLPLLRDYGIAFGQGFHLGKPIPLVEAFGSIPGVTNTN